MPERRILVIDSDAELRAKCTRVFKDEGFQVQDAADSTLARELVAQLDFDYLLCGLEMQDGGGHELIPDLVAEQQALDDLVSALDEGSWGLDTPSPGWTVAAQVAHLTYFVVAAASAIVVPDHFRAMVDDLMGVAGGGDDAVDEFTLGRRRGLGPAGLLDAWRVGRGRLAEAAATLADDTRVIWYGPSMGAKSFLTARLMEAWAHGQDVVDTVGGLSLIHI